jgi:hypothetical protein
MDVKTFASSAPSGTEEAVDVTTAVEAATASSSGRQFPIFTAQIASVL